MADEFQNFAVRLQQTLLGTEKFQGAIPDIEQLIRTSIEDNFRMGGRWGNDNPWGGGTERWAPTKHPDPSKRTLVDTADMLNSIDIRVEIVGGLIQITMSVRPFYARFHQEGTKHLPARPFLVLQDEDIDGIVEMMVDELRR